MGKDPIGGDVFISINRRANHIKLLHWEAGGFVIYYKRLEKRTFSLPKVLQSGNVSWSQLVMMIEGIKAAFFRLKEGEFITYADGKDEKVHFAHKKIERALPEKPCFTKEELTENFNRIYRESQFLFPF